MFSRKIKDQNVIYAFINHYKKKKIRSKPDEPFLRKNILFITLHISSVTKIGERFQNKKELIK